MVEKEKVKGYEVVSVATQTEPAIQTPGGDTLGLYEAVALALNEIAIIKKSVA